MDPCIFQIFDDNSLTKYTLNDQFIIKSSATSFFSSPSSTNDNRTSNNYYYTPNQWFHQWNYSPNNDYNKIFTPAAIASSSAFEADYHTYQEQEENHGNESKILIEMSPLTNCKWNHRSRRKCHARYANKKDLDHKRDLANQQERVRMHRLNDALKRLRNAIPFKFHRHPPGKKFSKIKTLRIAIDYINELSNSLNQLES